VQRHPLQQGHPAVALARQACRLRAGGPFGHAKEVRQRADDQIRLSSMVLNHQVAHVVLLEQLYRAWTILRGEPYHH
jgi:rRNA large subunit m3Psi methyltransferase RlmH